MEWNVVQTETFESWFLGLTRNEQAKILAAIRQLMALGPTLPFPLSSAIKGARHALRELRIQIVGGDKTGDERWYKRSVPEADRLFDEHLASMEEDDDG